MGNSNIIHEVSILINSCDKYADVWPVFFTLFWKYWPDCPYPVFLGANSLTWPDERVHVIRVGPDINWADTTIKMVKEVKSPYLLWFLDDFLIWETVNTHKIEYLFEEMKCLNANYLRIRNWPPIYKPVQGHPEIVEISPSAPYRCALEIAFWRRDALLDLLVPGETPWQMEKVGSRRSAPRPGFYSTKVNVIKRSNGLEKGKWIRHNLSGLKKEGLRLPNGHQIMSPLENLSYLIREKTFSFLISSRALLKDRIMKIYIS